MTTEKRPAETEHDMRKSVVVLAATILIAAAAAFTTPAAATEVKEAVTLCDNNPNCKSGTPDSTGAMLLNVKTSKGTTYIDCPPKGDCHILRHDPKGNVTDVVSGLETRATGRGGPGVGKASGDNPRSRRGSGTVLTRGVEGEPPASASTEPKDTATAPK